jgi:mannitol/fructose-specific phosphotransferase system IIA component (Ntr-type)
MEYLQLTKFLQVDRIFLDLDAPASHEMTVRELAYRIRDIPEIADFDQYISDVCEKENLRSSGVGFGVAFTYARSNGVDDVFVAFARLKHGVDFSAFDREPVRLVFLMGVPREQVHMQLVLLATLARVMSREPLRQALLDASRPCDVIHLLDSQEPIRRGNPA